MSRGGEADIKKKIFLVIYCYLILYYTVLSRSIGHTQSHVDLLWSYYEWFNGNYKIGMQILANIALFVPIGLFISKKKRWLFLPFLFSVAIEFLQLTTLRGTFELDDILNNTVGAILGWGIAKFLDKWETGKTVKVVGGILSVAVLSIVIIFNSETIPNTPRLLYFQAKLGNNGEVEGTAFRFDQNTPQHYQILLRNTQSNTFLSFAVKYGLKRPAIQNYFSCDKDYTYSGFSGKIDIDDEYEFIVHFNPLLSIPTGVYISSSSGIHYTKESAFTEPDIDTSFIKLGILRLYRPDYHCWVYQYKNSLYWVADSEFNFEEDGKTRIQYQLCTTQVDRLPENRLTNNWNWDNISGYFEEYELDGEWNGYRVMKRDIPEEYAVTSILTGYYRNGEWLWKEYFRPVIYQD